MCFCLLPETPLSLAVQCEPGGGEAIRVLVEGGAHIDFRAKDGLTPVHKAVRGHRHTALLVNSHMMWKCSCVITTADAAMIGTRLGSVSAGLMFPPEN